MHPILLRLDGLTLYTYGFFVGLGFLLGLALLLWRGRKEGIPEARLVDLFFLVFFSSIAGARALFVLIHPEIFREDPLGVFKVWEGGLVFYGGLLLASLLSLAYLKWARLPVWKVADLFSPAIAMGLVFGRIGCLMAGCCYGKETSLGWAIVFTDPQALAPLHLPLHPTQLYEALGGILLFFLLHWREERKGYDGQIFFLFLLSYSILRFFLEFLRGDPRGSLLGGLLSTSQGIGIFLASTSLFMLFYLGRRKRRE
ncbi:MAG: prolipoprotein diacylglyceryl transferase [Desulfobacterota bacterium]|nr:prolipoprotein diacylglyceryl transferase [Thermodesulfobacteriota bacterium]